jgi:hypothetical protein
LEISAICNLLDLGSGLRTKSREIDRFLDWVDFGDVNSEIKLG